VEERRFDALAKGLASGATRRRLLGGLAGGAAMFGLGGLAAHEADAKGKGKGKCKGKNKGRCDGKCVRLTNAKNCGACGRACASDETCSNGIVCQGKSCLAVTTTEGSVALAANGGLTLHSAVTPEDHGSFSFKFPKGATFADLASMELDFEFTDGSVCGAASPRFAVGFKDIPNNFLAAQIPTDLCSDPDQSGSSGNLVGNDTPFVWTNYGSGQGVDNTLKTYSEALTKYGDEIIGDLFVVLDSSNGQPQTVTLKPCVTLGSEA
jgi:hypothetical protein